MDVHHYYEAPPSTTQAFTPIVVGGLFNAAFAKAGINLDTWFTGAWYCFNVWTRLGVGKKQQTAGFQTLLMAASVPLLGTSMLNHVANRPGEWVAQFVQPFLQD